MRLADPNEQLVPDSIKLYLIWRQMDLNSVIQAALQCLVKIGQLIENPNLRHLPRGTKGSSLMSSNQKETTLLLIIEIWVVRKVE